MHAQLLAQGAANEKGAYQIPAFVLGLEDIDRADAISDALGKCPLTSDFPRRFNPSSGVILVVRSRLLGQARRFPGGLNGIT